MDSSTSAPQNSSFRRSYWASSDRRSYFKRHNTSYDDNVDLHQLAKITSTLRKFSASLLLSDQHKSSICHLQFSPDGYYLASGSSDHSASIWKLEGELGGIHYTFHDKLEHKGQGESVQQVAWSPSECRLLTRSSNIIHVWTAETNTKVEIKRHKTIQGTTWMPNGESFMVLEENHVHFLESTGNVVRTIDMFDLSGMKLLNMTLTPDGQHIIFIAAVPKPTDEEFKWSKCKLEKRIVSYNLLTNTIGHSSPIMDRARNLVVSRNGKTLLVSYENEHPPELWAVSGGENGADLDISLHYACDADEEVEFTGEACYGGSRDEFVICATKIGTIQIWDMKSGYLLHSLQTPQLRGDKARITGVAWRNINTAALASGHGDGAIFVWRANTQEKLPSMPKTMGSEHGRS
ncbi:hypothetical protein FRC02_010529 [Tulasnella sp. 418]|nr:hypothetical protein FRC02_010529 [Tulasnella sp. 418]